MILFYVETRLSTIKQFPSHRHILPGMHTYFTLVFKADMITVGERCGYIIIFHIDFIKIKSTFSEYVLH